ncbi:MAG: hypothetical protein Q9167_002935 [Letrouitia subvulpina]
MTEMVQENLREIALASHPHSSASSTTQVPVHEKALSDVPEESNVDPQVRLESEAPAKITPSNAGSPPNGGFRAWLHVLGAFLLWFNSWGILNTFGVFQTHYESGQLFTESSSNISWIGAVQSFMLLVVGIFAGPIYDRGYLRLLIIVGSFGVVFGHMMLSLCTTYWQVLLAQGFCVGIGAGCLFVPSVAVLPTYFSSRIGLAVGLGSSGSSIGGIIYPIVLYRLIGRIGFAWSVRVIGFIALVTLIVPIAVMRMRVKVPKARALVDWSAFTDVPYMVFVVATLIGFMGLNIILFYLSYDAQERDITNTKMAFYIIAIFNAASTFGRAAPNALSDKTGPFNLLAPCAIISGVLILCMIAVRSEAAIIVVAVLSGFFSGVFIAMPPVCFVSLIKDKTRIGTRMGMGFGMIAFGMLIGGPGGGAILGTQEPLEWTGLWAFGGVSAALAGIMYAGLRVARGGFSLHVKA